MDIAPDRTPLAGIISDANPMGTDGFEFVEYAAPDPAALQRAVRAAGLPAVARHRSKNVTLYRQGEINFIINAEPDSFAQALRARARPVASAPWRSASRMPPAAYERAHRAGRQAGRTTRSGRWS